MASVVRGEGKATITITDKNGTTSADVFDGDGQENAIETVKVNGEALPIQDKAVNIDLSEYVEKEDGKELVATSDVTQITTNKDAIATLNGTGEGSVNKKIADAMSAQTFLTKEIATAEEITAYTEDPTLAKFNVIYLLEDTTAKGSDKYFEYQRIGSVESSSFRMTGDTSTDLSDYAKSADVNRSLGGKVDKAEGMGLSQNSYTTTEKTKLSGIAEGANKTTVTASAETLTITIN